jgi:hypothetical protein
MAALKDKQATATANPLYSQGQSLQTKGAAQHRVQPIRATRLFN